MTKQEIDNIIDSSSGGNIPPQTGHPLAPGATLTPNETPHNPAPLPGVTVDQLKDIANTMSFSRYQDMKKADSGLQNIAPNMISGYGQQPMDFYPQFSGSREEIESKYPDYDTVYWNIQDNDFAGELGTVSPTAWFDNNIGSQADADYAAQIFNMIQAVNDYDRYQNAQKVGQEVRDSNLYGDALAEMLAKAQQSPAPLTQKYAEKPMSRKRNITGTYDWEDAGAFIPAGSPNYYPVGF